MVRVRGHEEIHVLLWRVRLAFGAVLVNVLGEQLVGQIH